MDLIYFRKKLYGALWALEAIQIKEMGDFTTNNAFGCTLDFVCTIDKATDVLDNKIKNNDSLVIKLNDYFTFFSNVDSFNVLNLYNKYNYYIRIANGTDAQVWIEDKDGRYLFGNLA